VEEASMIDQTISIERMASVRILYLGKIDSGEHLLRYRRLAIQAANKLERNSVLWAVYLVK
jgi:hypothetical protein